MRCYQKKRRNLRSYGDALLIVQRSFNLRQFYGLFISKFSGSFCTYLHWPYLTYSKNEVEHRENFRNVFEGLAYYPRYANLAFGVRCTEFLGLLIEASCIEPTKDKLFAVTAWKISQMCPNFAPFWDSLDVNIDFYLSLLNSSLHRHSYCIGKLFGDAIKVMNQHLTSI